MKKYLLPVLLALAVIAAVLTVVLVSFSGAAGLEQQLEGTWLRNGGSDWHLELKAEDGKLEYDFVSGQFPDVTETLYTYTYRAKSGTRLLVEYAGGGTKTVLVGFSADGKTMTLTPAITSAEDEEVWIRE